MSAGDKILFDAEGVKSSIVSLSTMTADVIEALDGLNTTNEEFNSNWKSVSSEMYEYIRVYADSIVQSETNKIEESMKLLNVTADDRVEIDQAGTDSANSIT